MPDELDAATLLDHAWPEPIPVCYNRRDLLLYALSIGCDELCFVHEDSSAFAAFPTYPAVLGFKGDALDVVSFPSPAMMQSPMPFLPGTRVILDAERYIERVRPLHTEELCPNAHGSRAGIQQYAPQARRRCRRFCCTHWFAV